MRAKVSECAASFWAGGELVWDDYVGQRQFALTPDAERALRWFATWRELASVRAHDPRLASVAEQLLDAGVLVAEGSAAHREEERILSRWRGWGAAARHYHFASRALAGARYLTLEEDRSRARDKARRSPSPPLAKTYEERPFVALPDAAPGDDAAWAHPGLLGALASRRSTRRFAPEPVTLAELAAVLRLANGVVDAGEDFAGGTAVFKTSPSAGARNPVELYVHAARVEGLSPGLYHHAPTRGGLEELGVRCPLDELLGALGGQPWLTAGAALILYTAVLERSAWRYERARAYRDVLLGLGHLSQTVLLVAAAMGLGAVFATAVCDEELELLIGCDPGEVLLGVAAVGRPAAADPEARPGDDRPFFAAGPVPAGGA